MLRLAEHLQLNGVKAVQCSLNSLSGMETPATNAAATGSGRPRFLIVDGHAYAYRAFYAIRELRSPVGEATNAIYGFIKMLAKMREKLAPTHLVVVWDGGLAAERKALLPEYKAQRPDMPVDLSTQLDQITDYLRAAGIASMCEDGVEADDRIATLAYQAVAQGMDVVIASSDKDFMQLISAEIGMLNPNDKSEQIWTAENVRNKTGVGPNQVVDWLSLIGDSVDNIGGVPGVGEKTATRLLQEYGDLDVAYQRLNEISSERLRSSLQAARSVVDRNRALIRLRADLPGTFEPVVFRVGREDVTALAAMYARWGFKTLLSQLSSRQMSGQVELFSAA